MTDALISHDFSVFLANFENFGCQFFRDIPPI